MFGHVVNVLGPVWSTRLISLTTIFVETFADMFAFGRKVGHGVVHWLGGSSHIWVFMRDNVGPFPSSAVHNYQNNTNVTWHFNLSGTDLTYVDSNYENEGEGNIIIEPKQLPWLSAKIVYNRGEYEIDEFASEFNFVVPQHVKPTPKLILNCWSIWSGIWLLPDQCVRFQIINHDGEEESFFIHSRPTTEVERWCELFEVDEEEDDSSEDGSKDGSKDGSEDGSEHGSKDGSEHGSEDGTEDGTEDGSEDGAEDGDDETSDTEKLDDLNVSDHSSDSAVASDESHTPPEIVEEHE